MIGIWVEFWLFFTSPHREDKGSFALGSHYQVAFRQHGTPCREHYRVVTLWVMGDVDVGAVTEDGILQIPIHPTFQLVA